VFIEQTLAAGTYIVEIAAPSSYDISFPPSASHSVSLSVQAPNSPRVTAVSPNRVAPGTTMQGGISGTNLNGVTAVTLGGTGVTADIGPGGTATFLPLTLTASANAAPGIRTVTATTSSATATLVSGLWVTTPGTATATAILPAAGIPGQTISGGIAGSNLEAAIDVSFSGTGVSAIIGGNRTSSSLPVTITIAAGAPAGPRTVTVVMPTGSISFSGFTVAPLTALPISWKPLAPYAIPEYVDILGASANVIGNRIYVSHGKRPFIPSAALATFDIVTNSWTYGLADAPFTAGYGLVSAALNGKVYVFSNDSSTFDSRTVIQEYDPSTNTWRLTGLPRYVEGTSAAAMNNRIYVVGGISGSLLVYDPATEQWTKLQSLPEPSSNVAAVVALGGRLYVFGGTAPTGATGKLQIYDVATDSWSNGTPMPTPRRQAMAGVISGQIAVFGGFDSRFGSLAVTELYNPATDSWTIGPDMLAAVYDLAQGATSVNNRIFAIGGSGISAQVLDADPSGPVITGISPATGAQGATVSATISGTNLSGVTSISFFSWSLTGVVGAGGTATSLPVTITIPLTAPPFTQSLVVNGPTVSSPVFNGFKVLSQRNPQVTSLSPGSLLPGVTVPGIVFGNDLLGAAAITVSGTGVSAAIVGELFSHLSVVFGVAADAAIGMRSLTVTTHAGTSQPLPVLITDIPPRMNDLTANPPGLSQTAAPYYGSAFALTVNGDDFRAGDLVTIAGQTAPTTFGSSTQLNATVPASVLTSAGTHDVKVTHISGSQSSPLPLRVGVRGDVTGNGSVSIGDALTIALTVGGITKPPFVATVGDVNLSGAVNIGDALMVALYSGRVALDWTVPQIASSSPSLAVPSNQLVLTGTGFSTDATANEVLVPTGGGGFVRLAVAAASSTALTITLPANAVSGPIQAYRTDLMLAGREFPLVVDGAATPLILSEVFPSSGILQGGSITLRGTGFDTVTANNTVSFASANGRVDGTVTASTSTSLTVTVPANAICGPVMVSTSGQTSNARIALISGSVCGLQLSAIWAGASPGETLVLEGAGFDPATAANNVVRFTSSGGTVIAPVLAAGATRLQVRVPITAVQGNVTVSIGGTTSNPLVYRPR